MESNPSIHRAISLSLFSLGAVSLLVGIIKIFGAIIFLLSAETSPGEVISIRKGTPFNTVQIEFTTPSLGPVSAEIWDVSAAPLNYGERVSMRYYSSSPVASAMPSTTTASALLCLFPVLWLVIGLLLIRVNRDIALSVIADIAPALRAKFIGFSTPPAGPAPRRNTLKESPQEKPAIPPKAPPLTASALSNLHNDPNLFGPLTALVKDPSVSDVIVANPDVVLVRKGSRTEASGVVFSGQAALETLVDRLLTAAGTAYSIAKPIADGNIGQQIRVHAVNPVLCEKGPYLTIRISRFKSVKDTDLISYGMISPEALTYLRSMVMGGHTVLIAGEVGTGKTTILRALASCMAKHESILVIEDTREINIEHPHVRYLHTREANFEGFGEVQPSDCIRAGMRMSMDRVIFGEIRDPDAAEAFVDVCSSGHPGLTTFHARSVNDAINRLRLLLFRKQPGLSNEALSAEIATAVQLVITTGPCRRSGRLRIKDLTEIGTNPDGSLFQNQLFKYVLEGDVPRWRQINNRSMYALADE